MVKNLVDVLIQKGILDNDHTEEYVYALTLLGEKMITYSMLFLVAAVTGNIVPGCIYICCFVALRHGTGGFHAEHFVSCLIGTMIIFLISLEILTPFIKENAVIARILLIISVLCIVLFSPVNHPNLALDRNELKQCRQWVRLVLCVEIGIYMAGVILEAWWRQYILVAILTCAVLILLAKAVRQEVSTYET